MVMPITVVDNGITVVDSGNNHDLLFMDDPCLSLKEYDKPVPLQDICRIAEIKTVKDGKVCYLREQSGASEFTRSPGSVSSRTWTAL